MLSFLSEAAAGIGRRKRNAVLLQYAAACLLQTCVSDSPAFSILQTRIDLFLVCVYYFCFMFRSRLDAKNKDKPQLLLSHSLEAETSIWMVVLSSVSTGLAIQCC